MLTRRGPPERTAEEPIEALETRLAAAERFEHLGEDARRLLVGMLQRARPPGPSLFTHSLLSSSAASRLG